MKGKRGSYFKHRPYSISALEQDRLLILGKFVLLGVKMQFINIVTLECFCEMQVKDNFLGSWALYLSFGTCYAVNIMQYVVVFF